MRLSKVPAVALALLSLTALSREAQATTDGPANYDARSVGMGGTGVAFLHNGASVYMNPATLHGINELAATGVITAFGPQLTAPAAGPQTEVETNRDFFPLFLVGAGYRLSERIVIGAAVFPAGGFGAAYEGVPGAAGPMDLELTVAIFEAAPAIAFAVTKEFSIGLGYRMTYMRESATQPTPFGVAEISLSGTSFVGANAGLFYKPNDTMRFGLLYRSKVTADLDGETKLGPAALDTTSEFSSPHTFKLGSAFNVSEQWMVALDLKYLMYSNSHEELSTTTTDPTGAKATQTIPLDWKDVYGVALGVEYHVVPTVPLRAGYNLGTSGTPDETANIFSAPPGLVHSGTVGVGLQLEKLELDLGGAYSFASKEVTTSTQGPPGRYAISAMFLSLGATYRL
jgi:long-chain fatty acid transport protein